MLSQYQARYPDRCKIVAEDLSDAASGHSDLPPSFCSEPYTAYLMVLVVLKVCAGGYGAGRVREGSTGRQERLVG